MSRPIGWHELEPLGGEPEFSADGMTVSVNINLTIDALTEPGPPQIRYTVPPDKLLRTPKPAA